MDDDNIDWSQEVTNFGNYLDRLSGRGKNQREFLSLPRKNKQPSLCSNKKQALVRKVIPDFDDAKWIEERKKRFPTSLTITKIEDKPNDKVIEKKTKLRVQSDVKPQRKKTLFEKLMEQQ